MASAEHRGGAGASDPDVGAASLVARALSRRGPGERGRFLRELLAHTAAGLVIIEGEREAGEAVYRLADAVVARGSKA